MQFKLITEHSKYSQLILIIFQIILLYIIQISIKTLFKNVTFIYGLEYT